LGWFASSALRMSFKRSEWLAHAEAPEAITIAAS
jgi:hypothetical protein